MRDIGKNIKDLRIRKNLTQDELAEKLFVTRQTVSNYETGKSRPDIDMLMQIAEVMEADIHEVLYGTPPAKENNQISRLVAGGVLTAALGVICLLTQPYAEHVRHNYFLVGPLFAWYCLLLPLFFLALGWTLTHLLGMALKKNPLSGKWTVYVRWFLLGLLGIYYFLMMSFMIPQLIGEYRFATATGSRSASDYIHVPEYARFFFYELLYPHLFAKHTPEVCTFTLPIGALLCFFGFPAKKK